jgi:DnaJ domain
MISDCRILGIEETEDEAAIKRAFRKKVKELHPDLAAGEDALRKHALFVQLCDAYKRLLGRARPDSRPRPAAKGAPKAGGLVAYSDPAYAFYKAGMRILMKIHPSQWNIDTQRMLNTKIAGSEGDQELIKRKVLDLVGLFPKAYYYFGLVVHEYPESDWAFDAQEKMDRIEERIGRYRRIIESFSSWNVDEKASIARYREKYAKADEALKATRRDPPKDWAE